MARLSDLIRDSKLETHFEPHGDSIETVHTYNAPDPSSRRRLVRRTEHWSRQSKIGGGSYGSVWLEKCTRGYRDVQVRAIKQIEKRERFTQVDYTRELEAIAKFSHAKYERCFVKSFGWYEGPEHLYIAMEYMDLGDLHTYLYRNPALPEHEARDVTYQILDGLSLMHENEFTHRDLKPSNILLKSCPPDEWWIKIADFGISKRTEEGLGLSTTVKGTLGYIAPEVYGFTERGSPYAVDIWAVGEIAFQMLMKKSTFKHIGLLSRYVVRPEMFPSQLLLDVPVSQLAVDFILSVMNPDPGKRVTAEQALRSEWMKQALPDNENDDGSNTEGGQDLSAIAEPAAPTNETTIEELGTWNTAHEATWDTSTITPATEISKEPTAEATTIKRKSLPETTVSPERKAFDRLELNQASSTSGLVYSPNAMPPFPSPPSNPNPPKYDHNGIKMNEPHNLSLEDILPKLVDRLVLVGLQPQMIKIIKGNLVLDTKEGFLTFTPTMRDQAFKVVMDDDNHNTIKLMQLIVEHLQQALEIEKVDDKSRPSGGQRGVWSKTKLPPELQPPKSDLEKEKNAPRTAEEFYSFYSSFLEQKLGGLEFDDETCSGSPRPRNQGSRFDGSQ